MSIFNLLDDKLIATIVSHSDVMPKGGDSHKKGVAFMLYGLTQLYQYFDFEEMESGLVDSLYRKEEHDYGIDAIYLTCNKSTISTVEELDEYNQDSKFVFHILQFKKGNSIDQASLLKFKEGVERVFINNDIEKVHNEYFYNKWEEIREIRDSIYDKFSADQVSVKLYLVFGGMKNLVEGDDLLMTQIQNTKTMLLQNGYQNNLYDIVDVQKLFNLERDGDEIIDVIKYEKTFKYITETDPDRSLTGYISVISGEHIAQLVKKYQTSIFEANIRDFYKKSDLNSKILETCTSEIEAKYFWSFNNGLTITCRKVEELPGDKYRLYGCQIVNGCQTSSSLYLSLHNLERYNYLSNKEELTKDENLEFGKIKDKKLIKDTNVIVRIIESNSNELIYRITETTNSQTPIKSFSLKANEDIQKHIEDYLLQKGVFYERRVNFYKNKGKRNVVSIQKLFQLYLSIVNLKPSQVRTRPKQMFLEYYDQVFPAPSVKSVNFILYLVPIKLDHKINKYIRYVQRNKLETDNYNSMLLTYGKFHLSVFVLKSILKNDYSEKGIVENADEIINILNDDESFLPHFGSAMESLKTVVQNLAGKKREAIPSAFKKADLDRKIARYARSKK